MKYELRSTEVFDKWLAKIKDRETHARIVHRIDNLAIGSFGDCKAIDAGLLSSACFLVLATGPITQSGAGK